MSESKSVKVIAISRGYINSTIIEEGTKFNYSGPFKKDKKGVANVLPLWVREIKKNKEFSEEELKAAKRDLEMETDSRALNAVADKVVESSKSEAALKDLV